MTKLASTAPEVFWSRVAISPDLDKCWDWQGHRNAEGYGVISTAQDKRERAHRIAYRLSVGEITPGEVIRHTCDRPPCCNPRHLLVGTQAENMADVARRGRWDLNGVRVPLRGEENPTAVLTEAAVREIRVRRESGETFRAIADVFGVSKDTIWHVVTKRTWKHVT